MPDVAHTANRGKPPSKNYKSPSPGWARVEPSVDASRPIAPSIPAPVTASAASAPISAAGSPAIATAPRSAPLTCLPRPSPR